MQVITLAASVVVWAAVHSWLASQRAKDYAGRLLGRGRARLYRLAYNGFAGFSFIPVLIMMRVFPDRVLYLVRAPWNFLFLACQALAALCLLVALLQTDVLQFVGLRQIAGPDGPSQLNTSGFYRLVRHPLYLFGLLFLWLTPMLTLNMLAVFVPLSIYLFVGAIFEERRLLSEFGLRYQEYRVQTPMIIPALRRRTGPTESRPHVGR